MKQQFINLAFQYGMEARYSGKERKFYLHPRPDFTQLELFALQISSHNLTFTYELSTL